MSRGMKGFNSSPEAKVTPANPSPRSHRKKGKREVDKRLRLSCTNLLPSWLDRKKKEKQIDFISNV